jgi:hypothetical protein
MAALKPVIQQDFSRGMNASANPYIVGPQQSLYILNKILAEHASLTTRDGTLRLTTSPDAPRQQIAQPVSIAAAGMNYVVGDTGTVTGGNNDAVYVVDTVDGGGGVLTLHLSNPGSSYVVAADLPTVATAGVGTGLLLSVVSVVSPPIAPIIKLYDFITDATGGGGGGGGGGTGPVPVVTVTFPVNGSVVQGDVLLQATATSSDPIASVTFKINGTPIGTVTSSPYQLTWPTEAFANNDYVVTATAQTVPGAEGTSVGVQVSVQNPGGGGGGP